MLQPLSGFSSEHERHRFLQPPPPLASTALEGTTSPNRPFSYSQLGQLSPGHFQPLDIEMGRLNHRAPHHSSGLDDLIPFDENETLTVFIVDETQDQASFEPLIANTRFATTTKKLQQMKQTSQYYLPYYGLYLASSFTNGAILGKMLDNKPLEGATTLLVGSMVLGPLMAKPTQIIIENIRTSALNSLLGNPYHEEETNRNTLFLYLWSLTQSFNALIGENLLGTKPFMNLNKDHNDSKGDDDDLFFTMYSLSLLLPLTVIGLTALCYRCMAKIQQPIDQLIRQSYEQQNLFLETDENATESTSTEL